MTDQKKDPTIRKATPVAEDRAPLVSEADHGGQPGVIKDMADKPDPTTIAQVQIVTEDDPSA